MSVFNTISGLRPKRYFYNLSFDKKFDCDMGQIIPLYAEESYPGDKFKLSNEIVIRFNPLNAPVLHEINVYTEYWFVPTRLIFDDWVDFITGGVDGNDSHTLPLWDDYKSTAAAKYTLWDYFGFPLVAMADDSNCPIDFGRRAYNLIWNEFYRDENIDSEVNLTNNNILYRRWKKDYFTSALPFRQRGQAATFSFDNTKAVFSGNVPINYSNVTTNVWNSSTPYSGSNYSLNNMLGYNSASSAVQFGSPKRTNGGSDYSMTVVDSNSQTVDFPYVMKNPSVLPSRSGADADKRYAPGLDNNIVDLSGVSFDVSDMRLAFQLQKFLERNARAGVRYPEFEIAHFGVSPSDSRLQRPEYLGGSKSPLLISEVLQTSEDGTTPQGHLAGRGIGVTSNYVGSYTCPEHGYIVGLFSIMPKGGYCSQGVNKKWLRRSRYDFYFPEFAHLSEQPIKTRELYVSGNLTNDDATFGFQPIYQELRHNRSEVTGSMRDTFAYWHLNRKFNSSPVLNSSFLECNPSKRIFAVDSAPGFIVDVGNIIKAVRPITKWSEPGLIDHF